MGDLLSFTNPHNDELKTHAYDVVFSIGDSLEIHKSCGSIVIGTLRNNEEDCLEIDVSEETQVLVSLTDITLLETV